MRWVALLKLTNQSSASVIYLMSYQSMLTACVLDKAFMVLEVRRVQCSQLSQIVRSQQGKDVGSKGEVVPLVQPLVPHVDCSEVLDVVASPWLDVVDGGCHHCVQAVAGQEGFKQC